MTDVDSQHFDDALTQPLPDGIVPEDEVVWTEKRWGYIVIGVLVIIAAVIVTTGVTEGPHPPSNVEQIDAAQVYQSNEFAESNIGTTIDPQGAATVRMIAQQYSFVPRCVLVPQGVPVTFRLTSADVIHGFLVATTNVNTMVIPGYVSEVHTRFDRTGIYHMPCDEFCGNGHAGMAAEIRVVPKADLSTLASTERGTCATQ